MKRSSEGRVTTAVPTYTSKCRRRIASRSQHCLAAAVGEERRGTGGTSLPPKDVLPLRLADAWSVRDIQSEERECMPDYLMLCRTDVLRESTIAVLVFGGRHCNDLSVLVRSG
jgi:hypothetical protein